MPSVSGPFAVILNKGIHDSLTHITSSLYRVVFEPAVRQVTKSILRGVRRCCKGWNGVNCNERKYIHALLFPFHRALVTEGYFLYPRGLVYSSHILRIDLIFDFLREQISAFKDDCNLR